CCSTLIGLLPGSRVVASDPLAQGEKATSVATTALHESYPVRAAALHVYSQALGLTLGTRPGVYDVAARIGEGGMGQALPRPTANETSGRHQDSHRVTTSATWSGQRRMNPNKALWEK